MTTQSVWNLNCGVSVGGQTILGIKYLTRWQPPSAAHAHRRPQRLRKSSFAEALEVLLTGDSRLLVREVEGVARRVAQSPSAASGPSRSRVHRRRPGPDEDHRCLDDGALLDARTLTVQPRSKPKTSLQALGWTDALVSYRRFLSYNELGSTLDEGPSKLYGTLSSILDLEDLVVAQNTLSKARLERQQAFAQAARFARTSGRRLPIGGLPVADFQPRGVLDAVGPAPTGNGITGLPG